MHIDDVFAADPGDRLPAGPVTPGPLRVIALAAATPIPQRRSAPRRRDATPVAYDRRRADRRRRAPGIDGLMRTVLSDSWPA